MNHVCELWWHPGKSNLPRPEDFSRALYTFDMGQNDLALFDQDAKTTEKKVRASIPDILEKFSKAIQVSKNTTTFHRKMLFFS